jgi:hypothetical protein
MAGKLFVRKKKVALEEEIAEKGSLLDEVDAYMEKNEVPAFDNNKMDRNYLILPTFIDELASNELGKFFHTFTLQKLWVRTLMARVGAMLREKNVELDKMKDSIFSQYPQRMSITEKELKLYSDPVASAFLAELAVIQEKYNMLDSYMKNLEDAIFNISREITRRSGDFADNSRGENINNKRR